MDDGPNYRFVSRPRDGNGQRRAERNTVSNHFILSRVHMYLLFQWFG